MSVLYTMHRDCYARGICRHHSTPWREWIERKLYIKLMCVLTAAWTFIWSQILDLSSTSARRKRVRISVTYLLTRTVIVCLALR